MEASLLNYVVAGFGALASILLSIAIVQLRTQGKTQGDHGKKLVRIETLLTGANGDNGLNGDVRDLKDWRQAFELEALPRRIGELERRHGPDDRRTA